MFKFYIFIFVVLIVIFLWYFYSFKPLLNNKKEVTLLSLIATILESLFSGCNPFKATKLFITNVCGSQRKSAK